METTPEIAAENFWRRFREGDHDVLEHIYRRYAPELASFLRGGFSFESAGRRLRFRGFDQPFELDNAIQETFLRAFSETARRRYDQAREFRHYLFAIARNWVVGELRRGEPTMVPLSAELRELPHSESDAAEESPEAVLLRRELGRLYQLFFATLTAEERAFFVSRFLDERTQSEVGAALALTPMQVRTRESQLKGRFLSFMSHGGEERAKRRRRAVPRPTARRAYA